jgi:hypothetical protein
MPANPITITSTSLSATSNSGAILIDTTQAHPGETATIAVTATDSVDSTHASQTFQVTVGPYSGPTDASGVATVNFKPYALPVTATTGSYNPVSITLVGQSTYPVTVPSLPPAYSILSTPAHGTISNFDPSVGTLTYTPTPGFLGTDSFTYDAYTNSPNGAAAAATSNPATVTITVTQGTVTLKAVHIITNSNKKVTELDLIWSGPLSPSLANSKAPFRLATANRSGSFTGRGSGTIAIRKAVYDSNTWTIALTPRTLFRRSQKLELIVHGNGSKGLKDIFGNFIAGSGGQSGTDAISIV